MPRVYDLGHSRAGDKGNTSNVSVIAYDETAWHILRRHLTAERVLAAYAHLGAGPVTRYELPLLRALNFVIENALRSEEHTSELQSLMRISYAVFCLKNKNNPHTN